MEDFARYLRTVGDKYDGFEHDRTSSEDRVRRNVTLTSGAPLVPQGRRQFCFASGRRLAAQLQELESAS